MRNILIFAQFQASLASCDLKMIPLIKVNYLNHRKMIITGLRLIGLNGHNQRNTIWKSNQIVTQAI